jgi:polyisoprenoid-binding protein YceI
VALSLISARPLPLIFATLAALFFAVACERKPKRVVRTEPWLAPAVSASSGGLGALGQPLHYEVTSASVRVELPARKAKPSGKLEAVSGSIELDPVELQRTRAKLRVDLLSLSLGNGKETDDPALVARAFDWLELSAEHGREERELNRYATLDITAFEPATPNDDRAPAPSATRVIAHGDLTLHHFRVPVTLELEVQLGGKSGKDSDLLKVRTRRPLVISLTAHDILPRDPRGTVLTNQLTSLGMEVGREARISAELEARVAKPPATPTTAPSASASPTAPR